MSGSDVRCPNDGEMTNVRCWKCGWVRGGEQSVVSGMGQHRIGPHDFTPASATLEGMRAIIERVEALERRVHELELRQERDDESARDRMERKG